MVGRLKHRPCWGSSPERQRFPRSDRSGVVTLLQPAAWPPYVVARIVPAHQ